MGGESLLQVGKGCSERIKKDLVGSGQSADYVCCTMFQGQAFFVKHFKEKIDPLV
jgi:hypothetical protein